MHNVQSAIALYILYIESKSYPNRDQNSDYHNSYILSKCFSSDRFEYLLVRMLNIDVRGAFGKSPERQKLKANFPLISGPLVWASTDLLFKRRTALQKAMCYIKILQ